MIENLYIFMSHHHHHHSFRVRQNGPYHNIDTIWKYKNKSCRNKQREYEGHARQCLPRQTRLPMSARVFYLHLFCSVLVKYC